MKLTRDLKEFIELLNAHGVEYLLVGGWAFGFHATPRYTGGIDFFLKCDEKDATRLKRVLLDFGLGTCLNLTQASCKRIASSNSDCHRTESIY
jgi:hypothetical protein